MKDQYSFPLHFWHSVAVVVSVVVAVVVVVVVAGAIDEAEPEFEPGRDAVLAGFAESDKDHSQTRLMPMKVILMSSFDEIQLQLPALYTEMNSRFITNKF